MSFERGFLSKPAVRALLDRWTAEDEARRQREYRDQQVTTYLTKPRVVAPVGGGEERER